MRKIRETGEGGIVLVIFIGTIYGLLGKYARTKKRIISSKTTEKNITSSLFFSLILTDDQVRSQVHRAYIQETNGCRVITLLAIFSPEPAITIHKRIKHSTHSTTILNYGCVLVPLHKWGFLCYTSHIVGLHSSGLK